MRGANKWNILQVKCKSTEL